MKIGVISDTHTKVKLAKHAIKKLLDEGAEYFIHSGDIVKEEVLEALKATKLPYTAVFGNNDHHLFELKDKYNLVHEPYYFKLKHVKFKLMHHPFYFEKDADIIIYGHTHFFEAKMAKGVLYLNSGEICARKKDLSECALLEFTKSKYTVRRFTCKPEKLKWKEEKKVFDV